MYYAYVADGSPVSGLIIRCFPVLQIGENDPRFGPRFPAIGPAYSPALRELTLATAERLGLGPRMRVGTYVGVAGTNLVVHLTLKLCCSRPLGVRASCRSYLRDPS